MLFFAKAKQIQFPDEHTTKRFLVISRSTLLLGNTVHTYLLWWTQPYTDLSVRLLYAIRCLVLCDRQKKQGPIYTLCHYKVSHINEMFEVASNK